MQKNVKNVMTSNVWHCFCTYHTKEHTCLLHFSIIMSHSVLSGTYSAGRKTKMLTPRPKPRPVWDQSCHKTAVSDPKTRLETNIIIRIESWKTWQEGVVIYILSCKWVRSE